MCKVKAFVLSAGVLAFSWSVWDGKQEVVLADTQTVHKPHKYNCSTYKPAHTYKHKQCYLAVSLTAVDACWGPGGTAGVRRGESATHPPWSECAACPRSLGEEGQRNPPRTHTRLPQSHCLESETEITNQFQNELHILYVSKIRSSDQSNEPIRCKDSFACQRHKRTQLVSSAY